MFPLSGQWKWLKTDQSCQVALWPQSQHAVHNTKWQYIAGISACQSPNSLSVHPLYWLQMSTTENAQCGGLFWHNGSTETKITERLAHTLLRDAEKCTMSCPVRVTIMCFFRAGKIKCQEEFGLWRPSKYTSIPARSPTRTPRGAFYFYNSQNTE